MFHPPPVSEGERRARDEIRVQGLCLRGARTRGDARRGVGADRPAKRLTWVVIGDRKRMEKSVRDLKIADVRILDADGNVVK
jgi:hypothetical protein